MKTKLIPVLALVTLFSAQPIVQAEDSSEQPTAYDRYAKAAQKCFGKGQYKQAELLWNRTLTAMEEDGVNNCTLADAHKRLGETLLKEGKYPEADADLKRAADIYKSLAIEDSELVGDETMLAEQYRAVNMSLLGKLAVEALTKASMTSFCLIKRANGANHVQIQLPDRYNKLTNNKDIDELGFDKIVTFDIASLPDGSVKIDNIKGFRVHAGMWVTILQSVFRPAEAGQHIAEVTAGKMGVTKMVQAHLSDEHYAPINGLVAQMMGAPSLPPTEAAAAAANSAAVSSPATADQSSTSVSTTKETVAGPASTSSVAGSATATTLNAAGPGNLTTSSTTTLTAPATAPPPATTSTTTTTSTPPDASQPGATVPSSP
ncbi:MAG TPA: tetratricopeptide repeat protein [Planktothrix sp.]|jgi:hypothetical protein